MSRSAIRFVTALVVGSAILAQAANAAPRHTQGGPDYDYSQAPLSDSIKDRTGQGF